MFSFGSGNVAVYERIVKSAAELTGDLRSDTLYKIDGARHPQHQLQPRSQPQGGINDKDPP